MTLHHPCGSRLEDRIVVRTSLAFSVTLLGTSCWTSVLTQGKPCFAVISIPFYYSFVSLFFATFGFRLSTLLCGLSGPLGSVFLVLFLVFFGFFINGEFGGLISLKVAFFLKFSIRKWVISPRKYTTVVVYRWVISPTYYLENLLVGRWVISPTKLNS